MRIVTIIGARPQFIKAAPVCKALRNAGHNEIVVHTGQHYDEDMSGVFFRELKISAPTLNLGVGSGSHGYQTGQILMKVEEVLLAEKPDCVLVYGDTNSTLGGALAAVKLRIPLAHVEAGLRSFNREMPEEHNRVLTDHCSDILFCPTKTAVSNLSREGLRGMVNKGEFVESLKGCNFRWNGSPLVVNVGDTMYDAILQFSDIAQRDSTVLDDLRLKPKGYFLATLHRPYNTDISDNLISILSAFVDIGEPIVFPVHPRTIQKIGALGHGFQARLEKSKVCLLDPVGYLDMLALEQNARAILTDSGGIQKEAYIWGVPCLTLRPETEWIETVEEGWNVIVGNQRSLIVQKALAIQSVDVERKIFGDGCAGERIVHILENAIM